MQHVNQQERERARFGGTLQSQSAAAAGPGPTEVRVTLQSLIEFLEGTVPNAGRSPMPSQQQHQPKQPPHPQSASQQQQQQQLEEGERGERSEKSSAAPAGHPAAGQLPAVRGPAVGIGLGGEALARRLFTETQITLLVLNIPRQATNSLATFLQVCSTVPNSTVLIHLQYSLHQNHKFMNLHYSFECCRRRAPA